MKSITNQANWYHYHNLPREVGIFVEAKMT